MAASAVSVLCERVPAEGGAAVHGAGEGGQPGEEGKKVTSSPQSVLSFVFIKIYAALQH